MSAELLPPVEFDHPLPAAMTVEERVLLWLDLLDASEQMLIAGLKATAPAGSDVNLLLQQWYDNYAREKMRVYERMSRRLEQAEAGHGGTGGISDA